MKTLLAAIAIVLILPLTISAQQPNEAAGSTITLSGTMVHTTIEGGCWYLDASDGKHYELIGDRGVLSAVRQEGKYVQVRVKPTKDLASICMVGPIMEVVEDVTPQLHPIDPAIIRMDIEGTMKHDKKGWYVKTAKGLRYEFDGLPLKKYRRVGRHYKHTDRVVIVPGEKSRSGLILGPVQQNARTTQKPTPDAR